MLRLTIPMEEMYDEETNTFSYRKQCDLCLEHSLVSISKWESIWHKPFLSKEAKTAEETLSYIKCMTISSNVDDSIYEHLTQDSIKKISEYIDNPMTATWFSETEGGNKSNNEVVTSEVIYYWMVALNINWKCEKWHINRLLTLIRVCNIKNTPPKKMSKRDILKRNQSLNAQRRKALNSKG